MTKRNYKNPISSWPKFLLEKYFLKRKIEWGFTSLISQYSLPVWQKLFARVTVAKLNILLNEFQEEEEEEEEEEENEDEDLLDEDGPHEKVSKKKQNPAECQQQ